MNRLRSLDVFRGAAVALMILVNNPGSWEHLYPPLAHAAWHGVTPTDLVFPFFLFAVGNAMALRQGPDSLPRVARRTLLIFAIGLLLNAAPFVQWNAAGELVLRDVQTLRIMGVLQRIALCFGMAALLLRWCRPLPAAGFRLVAYWIACVWLGAPGDPYSLSGWFGTAIDRALLGESHLYRGAGVAFDPEGLASTAPAVAQVLLGYWVGTTVRREPPDAALVARLFLQATLLLLAAYLWQLVMPLNKKIWTSSYVLLTTGLAMTGLAVLVHLVEIRGRAAPLRFFEVFGLNALFVFVLSGLVPRFLGLIRWPDSTAPWTTPMPWAFEHVFAPLGGSDLRLGSLLFALANVGLYGVLAWALHRRRIYIRV